MSAEKKRRRVSPLTVLGVLLMVCGLAVGGWYVHQIAGESEQDTELQAQAENVIREYDREVVPSEPEKELKAIEEPDEIKNGATVGVLKIPSWGKDHAVPVIEGTTQENLDNGVGRYDYSARPGQEGNLAIAGHRSGDPQPFRNLLEVNVGDKVILETKAATYTYEVTKSARDTTVVAQDGGWVVNEPEVPSDSKHTITLTTCTHLYHSWDRSVMFGELVDVEQKYQEVSPS